MPRISLIEQAHSMIAAALAEGDIAIDATVGNGFDTVFLAQQVGASGKVFGFDIQQAALQTTRIKLLQLSLLDRVELFQANHIAATSLIEQQFHGLIRAVMFNLGYLPGSDKQQMTTTETTLTALDATLRLLTRGGILTVIAYPGHPGGAEETQAVANWSMQLNSSVYKVEAVLTPSPSPKAPQLFAVKRC